MAACPYQKAKPVANITLPVIQIREVDTGETVGYSNTWTAPTPRRIATVSAGYADGIIRAMGPKRVCSTKTSAAQSLGVSQWI